MMASIIGLRDIWRMSRQDPRVEPQWQLLGGDHFHHIKFKVKVVTLIAGSWSFSCCKVTQGQHIRDILESVSFWRHSNTMRWFHLKLLLVLSTSPSHPKPATNFHPQSNRSYRKYLQHPGEAIVPIEAWHNDVSSVRGKYEEEDEEVGGFGGNNIVGKEDPWYAEGGEEEEALTNEREDGPREMLEGSHPLMQNGILGTLGLAKAAFQSLRGNTAEKLQLPEDRKRLVELVRSLLKPNLSSPGLVQRLLDEKTELNTGLRKDSLANEENEMEPEIEAEGGVGGQIQQHQKPQPVLLLLKGWLVHV